MTSKPVKHNLGLSGSYDTTALELDLRQKIVGIVQELPNHRMLEVLDFVEFIQSKQKTLVEDRSNQILENNEAEDPKLKQKSRTIAQAILEVMQETNRPMSSQKICQSILDKQLYHFNTDDTHGMVYNSLWRHSVNKLGKTSSPNKHFIQDGKYWIIASSINIDKDYPITEDAKEISMRELEESIYEYFLMAEFEEDIQP
jgi:hypothetical protein